jgi:hypothetical protein
MKAKLELSGDFVTLNWDGCIGCWACIGSPTPDLEVALLALIIKDG